MKNKKILLVIFIVIAGIQLAIPASIVFQQENVLSTGTIYKFRTAPVDPSDPFRGKYITLSFSENKFPAGDRKKWENIRDVYVTVKNDSAGYAEIANVTATKPTDGEYVKAKVSYISYEEPPYLMIEFPFNRFYMEESKAGEAEIRYNSWQRDSSLVTYAKVRVKKDVAVLEDVLVGEVSINEKVKEPATNK